MKVETRNLSAPQLRSLRTAVDSSNNEAMHTKEVAKIVMHEQMDALEAHLKSIQLAQSWITSEFHYKFVEVWQGETSVSWKGFKTWVEQVVNREKV